MRPKLSRSPRSRPSASEVSVPGKTFVSYEHKAAFHIISYQGKISLVNLSKCFLGNRDNFCPYEQALSFVTVQLRRHTRFCICSKYETQVDHVISLTHIPIYCFFHSLLKPKLDFYECNPCMIRIFYSRYIPDLILWKRALYKLKHLVILS